SDRAAAGSVPGDRRARHSDDRPRVPDRRRVPLRDRPGGQAQAPARPRRHLGHAAARGSDRRFRARPRACGPDHDCAVTWDASTYEKVADPQAAWADEIIARSEIKHGDVVLDAGCGGGRVTKKLLELTPNVIAVDGDPNMVAKARESLPESVPVYHQDLL